MLPRILAALIALTVGWLGWRALTAPEDNPAPTTEPAPPSGPMTEAEREAYVEAFVRADNVEIGPDLHPDTGAPIPGLFYVTGTVINTGEREVDKVVFTVLPHDAAGSVLGSYLEDLAHGRPLKPGDQRTFRFTIPEKKDFSGEFDFSLR